MICRFHISTPTNTKMYLKYNNVAPNQIIFGRQHIARNTLSKKWNLQRNIYMPNQVWSCGGLLRLRTSEKKIPTSDWISTTLSNFHNHWSWVSTCKFTLKSKSEHSPTNSSSQANNWRRQFQASPPSPQPKANMSGTDAHFSTAKSNNYLNLSYNEISTIHLFVQKKVSTPLPIFRDTFSSN